MLWTPSASGDGVKVQFPALSAVVEPAAALSSSRFIVMAACAVPEIFGVALLLTTPLAGVTMTGASRGVLIVRLKVPLVSEYGPAPVELSVTDTAKSNDPLSDGVPVMVQSEFNDTPAGKMPDAGVVVHA